MASTESTHAEATIVRENGTIFLKTAEDIKQLSSGGMLLQEVQSIFQVDFGYRGKEQKPLLGTESGEQCPYCGSLDTMGNGTRATKTEIQNRRFCKTCRRSYAVGKTYPKIQENPKRIKEKIRFLTACQFNPLEISKELDVSLPSVLECMNTITDRKLTDLNRLNLLEPFETSKIIPDRLGRTTVWDYNGSLALKRAGNPNIVYISKLDKKLMEQLSGEQLNLYLSKVPPRKRVIIKEFINDVLDYKLGILPRTCMDTKPLEDCGEIDPDVFDEGQEQVAGTESSQE